MCFRGFEYQRFGRRRVERRAGEHLKCERMEIRLFLAFQGEVVSQMLNSVPEAEKVKTSSAAELTQLITAIKNGAASNNQSARFLEIVTKLAR